jgi:hypothetical protein
MSPLFGKKNTGERTVLILDVENGSVGACLVRLSPNHLPKMFGEVRKIIPPQVTHDTDALARRTLQALEGALAHTSHVAARVRTHSTFAPAGQIDNVVVFFSPPWGALSIADRELPLHPFGALVKRSIEAYAGPVGITFQPFGFMAAHTTPLVIPSDDHYLISAMSGEVTELILLENMGSHLKIVAHATLPLGRHYPLRTLLTHGGYSEAEALSLLRLSGSTASEALLAASAHAAREFGSVARELLKHVEARRIIVVGQEPTNEWFARSLAQNIELHKLFPNSGEVRTVKSSHVLPYVGVHASRPDLPLLMEVLFVNTHLPVI